VQLPHPIDANVFLNMPQKRADYQMKFEIKNLTTLNNHWTMMRLICSAMKSEVPIIKID
jgi:hypothetical protein